MPEHAVHVEPAPVPTYESRPEFRARCVCGWRSTPTRSKSNAQADGLLHLSGKAPARKPQPSRYKPAR